MAHLCLTEDFHVPFICEKFISEFLSRCSYFIESYRKLDGTFSTLEKFVQTLEATYVPPTEIIPNNNPTLVQIFIYHLGNNLFNLTFSNLHEYVLCECSEGTIINIIIDTYLIKVTMISLRDSCQFRKFGNK